MRGATHPRTQAVFCVGDCSFCRMTKSGLFRYRRSGLDVDRLTRVAADARSRAMFCAGNRSGRRLAETGAIQENNAGFWLFSGCRPATYIPGMWQGDHLNLALFACSRRYSAEQRRGYLNIRICAPLIDVVKFAGCAERYFQLILYRYNSEPSPPQQFGGNMEKIRKSSGTATIEQVARHWDVYRNTAESILVANNVPFIKDDGPNKVEWIHVWCVEGCSYVAPANFSAYKEPMLRVERLGVAPSTCFQPDSYISRVNLKPSALRARVSQIERPIVRFSERIRRVRPCDLDALLNELSA